MAVLKHSKQRDSIQQFLKKRKDHPTADTVYAHIREEYPNISLGTVYRNLALLSDMGVIQKISTADGGDRFDGNPVPHYHFICTNCQAVSDIEMEEIQGLNELAGKNFDGEIKGHLLQFFGTCCQCQKNNK